jgi:hypothetical protein
MTGKLDLSTTKSVIDLAYALISGRAGEARDWTTWRTLYVPNARLVPIEAADDGSRIPRLMTPDEFIASRDPFFMQNDFFEWETAREERRYGSLAQVWSSYEAGRTVRGDPIRKGVNSVQLWNDGSRWWIFSIAWDAVEALISPPAH